MLRFISRQLCRLWFESCASRMHVTQFLGYDVVLVMLSRVCLSRQVIQTQECSSGNIKYYNECIKSTITSFSLHVLLRQFLGDGGSKINEEPWKHSVADTCIWIKGKTVKYRRIDRQYQQTNKYTRQPQNDRKTSKEPKR